jgi:drug/metabolite transporter (DMT)-like permease
MKPKEYLALFALAALWGASFLFIKVAIADMTPLTLVAMRLVFGALGLLVVVPFKPAIMKGSQPAGFNRSQKACAARDSCLSVRLTRLS